MNSNIESENNVVESELLQVDDAGVEAGTSASRRRRVGAWVGWIVGVFAGAAVNVGGIVGTAEGAGDGGRGHASVFNL